jgi:hypothetical protein
MDRNKDAKLTYDEFVEGSKQDPTIVQVSPHSLHMIILERSLFLLGRHYRYTMVLYNGVIIVMATFL